MNEKLKKIHFHFVLYRLCRKNIELHTLRFFSCSLYIFDAVSLELKSHSSSLFHGNKFSLISECCVTEPWSSKRVPTCSQTHAVKSLFSGELTDLNNKIFNQ